MGSANCARYCEIMGRLPWNPCAVALYPTSFSVAIGCAHRHRLFPLHSVAWSFFERDCYDAAFSVGCTKPDPASVSCRAVGKANQGQVRVKTSSHRLDDLFLQLPSSILPTTNCDFHFLRIGTMFMLRNGKLAFCPAPSGPFSRDDHHRPRAGRIAPTTIGRPSPLLSFLNLVAAKLTTCAQWGSSSSVPVTKSR